LLKVGLPVFARGVTPNSGFRNGPGEINTGVTCGGVFVGAGDIVAGDRDGVVVVALEQARAIAASLAQVERKEAEAEQRIAGGELRRFWNPEAFAGRVRYVD
jgi:regulator of RNase E activity RraA